MLSNKYLSNDDLNFTGIDFSKDIPLITAPVGYGKTEFAIKHLSKCLEEASGRQLNKILFLCPNAAIREQVESKYKGIVKRVGEWELCGYSFAPSIDVACIQVPASIIDEGKEINAKYDLVIIDEIDQVVKWSCCFKNILPFMFWLKGQMKQETIVCGLTATPDLLTEYTSNDEWHFVDVTRTFEPKHKANYAFVIPSIKPQTLLEAISPTLKGKTIVYCQSANECYGLSRRFNNSAFIVSQYNEDNPKGQDKTLSELMNAQQIKGIPIRDYILNERVLPEGIDILFINDACSCGMSIEDEQVRNIVCYSYELDTIRQVAGRVRHDIDNLYICYTLYQQERLEGISLDGLPQEAIEMKYAMNQKLTKQILNKGDKPHIAIDCFKNHDGTIKANPFYDALAEYRQDSFNEVINRPEEYFKALNSFSERGVKSMDTQHFRDMASAARRNSKIDLIAAFGLNPNESKQFKAKELTQMAKNLKVLKPTGKGFGGKETLIQLLNESDKYKVNKINNRPVTYEVIRL